MGSSDTVLARLLALHPKLIDLSLGRILTLLERLGDPQKRLPPVIHVAGTNGKGSTIAFMRAILEAAGLSVHVYTSPHLVRFHERIRLGAPGGGRFVDETVLVEALERCERANAGDAITFFEITTAVALLLFAEHEADVVLLEVGLGGRFDATNVIANPACTVVTPVSLDHAEYLGDTVTKIAGEKAGIFKRGAPAVIAPQEPEPTAVLEATAERVGASKILIGAQDFSVHEAGGRLVYEDGDGLLDLPCRSSRAATSTSMPGPRSQPCARPAMAACRAPPSSRACSMPTGRRGCSASRAASSRNWCPAGPNSGSMAATTPMAAACWPRPWPISPTAIRRRW